MFKLHPLQKVANLYIHKYDFMLLIYTFAKQDTTKFVA